jgi:hypothetical protein
MTVRIRDGFEYLVTQVRSYLTTYGVTCTVAVGFRELAKQTNQGPGRANRLVFVPSTENGDAGRIVSVRDPGRRVITQTDPSEDPDVVVGEVRALGDWDQNITLSVFAHDGANPRDELAQHVAVSELLQWAKRAIDSTGFANIAWGAVRYVVPKENTFGAELRVGLTFMSPIFDVPLEVATPGFTISKE